MRAKPYLFAMILFSSSFALAGTSAIGTVSARGDLRVDGYTVRGNATLFDGTAVETDHASATLHLAKGTEIKLANDSRGTLYSDRLVLLRGATELNTSNAFLLEASDLRVTADAPNTKGIVMLSPANTVEVAAVAGELKVTDDGGTVLARVSPGSAASFPGQAGPGLAAGEVQDVVGLVSVQNGNYYLTTADNTQYLLTGKDFKKYLNDKVVVSGTLQPPTTAGGVGTIAVKSIGINGGGSAGAAHTVMWINLALLGATVGWAIDDALSSASP
jgi:hypothetical protein